MSPEGTVAHELELIALEAALTAHAIFAYRIALCNEIRTNLHFFFIQSLFQKSVAELLHVTMTLYALQVYAGPCSHFTLCAGMIQFRCFHFFAQRLVEYDT